MDDSSRINMCMRLHLIGYKNNTINEYNYSIYKANFLKFILFLNIFNIKLK